MDQYTYSSLLLQGNSIITPPTHGTILPGVTRKSTIEIARTLGYQVIMFSLCYPLIGFCNQNVLHFTLTGKAVLFFSLWMIPVGMMKLSSLGEKIGVICGR